MCLVLIDVSSFSFIEKSTVSHNEWNFFSIQDKRRKNCCFDISHKLDVSVLFSRSLTAFVYFNVIKFYIVAQSKMLESWVECCESFNESSILLACWFILMNLWLLSAEKLVENTTIKIIINCWLLIDDCFWFIRPIKKTFEMTVKCLIKTNWLWIVCADTPIFYCSRVFLIFFIQSLCLFVINNIDTIYITALPMTHGSWEKQIITVMESLTKKENLAENPRKNGSILSYLSFRWD